MILLLLVPLVVLAAVWGTPAAPFNVVIVTLDTTRADRLPAYGFMDASMPHLDRLAAEGVVFDRATSVAPLTLPAHASLFTGLLPPAHGVRDNADRPLAERHTTLAEVLRARGFRTGAFVGSVVLGADRGLAQGFATYGEAVAGDRTRAIPPQRRADAVITDAIDWLDTTGGSPFFLWAHLYDAHRPYEPPEPFRSLYADPYVAEIAFVDSQIGRLLDALDRRRLAPRTVVIVAGDHGESLGEHGEDDHGIFVYESVLRVPLIVRAPSIAPTRVHAVVRLTDVMPTVLDLLDVPAPPADGVSVAALMTGTASRHEVDAYAESMYPQRFGWSPLRALHDGRFKFIEAPRPELYDLERDPFEERNIVEERPALARAMARRLMAMAGRVPDRRGDGRATIPTELGEGLAALGYIGIQAPAAAASPEHSPDPKDRIDSYNRRRQRDAGPALPRSSR
jgi:arylsulfatase A-like enzyme